MGSFDRNIEEKTVDGFGYQWQVFNHSHLSDEALQPLFEQYFRLFPWKSISGNAVGLDLGCRSGRWARFVAPRVGRLICVDASVKAIAVAKENLV
ncbi:MAG: hypothetical protein ACE5H1_08890 [Thermodesulfobacteriota bacterium]